MVGSIEETLCELDTWYNEIPSGTERPKLLSKIAIMELSGWIETHLDVLVEEVGQHCGLELEWVREKVIKSNYGFSYVDHMRPMLVRLIGEVGIRAVEASLEKSNPGILEQLRSDLGSLWKMRGNLAHSNLTVNQQ